MFLWDEVEFGSIIRARSGEIATGKSEIPLRFDHEAQPLDVFGAQDVLAPMELLEDPASIDSSLANPFSAAVSAQAALKVQQRGVGRGEAAGRGAEILPLRCCAVKEIAGKRKAGQEEITSAKNKQWRRDVLRPRRNEE